MSNFEENNRGNETQGQIVNNDQMQGQTTYDNQVQPEYLEKPSVAPLVLGILGFSGLLMPLLGYVFSITGIVVSNKDKKKPNSQYGTIGLVLSIIALVITILIHIFATMVLMKAKGL